MITSASTYLTPLLKSHHFADLRTQLTGQGIRLDRYVTQEDREYECNEQNEDLQNQRMEYLVSLGKQREKSWVSVNPLSYTAVELLQIFSKAKADELSVNLKYGIPDEFDLSWKRLSEKDSLADREGQHLLIVIYDNDEPVGFQSFICEIRHPLTEIDQLKFELNVELVLAYVIPSHRQKGYGLDLSLACGRVISDILHALYLAAPEFSEISSSIETDYDSDGGEIMATQIYGCLDGEVLSLRSSNERPTVQLKDVFLDGCP